MYTLSGLYYIQISMLFFLLECNFVFVLYFTMSRESICWTYFLLCVSVSLFLCSLFLSIAWTKLSWKQREHASCYNKGRKSECPWVQSCKCKVNLKVLKVLTWKQEHKHFNNPGSCHHETFYLCILVTI